MDLLVSISQHSDKEAGFDLLQLLEDHPNHSAYENWPLRASSRMFGSFYRSLGSGH